MQVALLDTLVPTRDFLESPLRQSRIEGRNVGTRKGKPATDCVDEILSRPVDARLAIARVFNRQQDIVARHPPTWPIRRELTGPEFEDVRLAVKGNVDDDPVARKGPGEFGVLVAEGAAPVPRHIDRDLLHRLHPHFVGTKGWRCDGEVMGQGLCPFLRVGLFQALLRLGLDRASHLLTLRLERRAQIAALKEVIVHSYEDSERTGGGFGGWRRWTRRTDPRRAHPPIRRQPKVHPSPRLKRHLWMLACCHLARDGRAAAFSTSDSRVPGARSRRGRERYERRGRSLVGLAIVPPPGWARPPT